METLETEPKPRTKQLPPTFEYAQAVGRRAVAHLRYFDEADITDMSENGQADCLGYTITGSEALDQAKIDHSVAYVNGHATILLPVEDQTWSLDLLVPKLQQRIDNKLIIQPNSGSATRTVGKISRTAMFNDTDLTMSFEEAIDKIKWLRSPRDAKSVRFGDYSYVQTKPDRALIMTIYPSTLGREVVYLYGLFRDAHKRKDMDAAGDAIIALGENFPEIDMRKTTMQRDVKSVLKQLILAGEIEKATQAMEAYFSGLNEENDSRIAEYRADFWRYLAELSSHPSDIPQAISLYKRALNHRNAFTKAILHKIELCRALEARRKTTEATPLTTRG